MLTAGGAFAHQCTNASRNANNPAAGAQVVFGGEDGDGVADASTYLVGKNGEIPTQAQENGAACKGIVNIEDYMACSAP